MVNYCSKINHNLLLKITFLFFLTELDAAIATFRALQKEDPYRLDNLDAYSNLLYVKDLRVELSHLAHHAWEVDKYRVETCCVVGKIS